FVSSSRPALFSVSSTHVYGGRHMRTRLRLSVIAVMFVAATASVAAQQGTSEIKGRIADEQGNVLPGATIVITNEDTGIYRETTSGGDGTYIATQMVPGRYQIVAKLQGFRTIERPGLVLAVGNTLTI